jgi:signal transduction histidine kinase
VATIEDITARKHAEELSLQNLQLQEQLQALEAQRVINHLQGEFLSTVSHEFRTPLASLVGFSELLLDRQVDAATARQWIETMHSEAERLAHLVTDVLDVARIEENHMTVDVQALDVTAAIEQALAPFTAQGLAHRLERRYGRPLLPVLADSDKLTQILTNLVSNALKYSPAGGNVTISAQGVDRMVRLSVADQGLGIPPEELSRLFGRFHRINDPARRQIGGTGLGLYITKRLVELHGGRIWVESPGPGQGSTFHVELPAAENALAGD